MKEKSEIEILNIDYFYKKFELERRRYKPSLFCSTDKRKRSKPVELKLYKKIVLEYLKLYFFDFYTMHKPIYFPLGGFMKKVKYNTWARKMKRSYNQKEELHMSSGAIGLFWFFRPSKKMFYMVKLKKLTGKTNRLPEIEEMYKDNFNKDLLPIFKTEIKKAQKNKTLYLCTLTS